MAVDNSESLSDWATGDVYVSISSSVHAVYVFHREANGEEHYVTELPAPELRPGVPFLFVESRAIAVDESNGDVFVAYYEVSSSTRGFVVDELQPTAFGQYTFVRQLTGTSARGFGDITDIAVDASNGDVYVVDSTVIDRFSSEGVYLGQLTGTPAGPFGRTRGVAVDPVSHNLFVSDEKGSTAVVDIFGPLIVVPDVTTSPASVVGVRKATLEGTVNPDEVGAATCQFEWGTSESFGQISPCSEAVANGHSPMAVHAELTGLQPDTTYYYRLQASNANGTSPGEASQDRAFRTLGPPIVQEASASVVTSTSATLDAEVNPNTSPTSYYFEYGTSASYGASVPAPPGASVGSGEGAVAVSVHLQGLSPGTTYHYRVVAVNEPEGERFVVESPDGVFVTQAAGTETALPDGRAWEMVTPPNKQGSGLAGLDGAGLDPLAETEGNDIQAAVDGGAIVFTSTAPLEVNPAGARSPEVTEDMATRTAPGSWRTVDLATPHEEGPSKPLLGEVDEYRLFSSDLSLGLVEPEGNTPLPPLPAGAEKTLYLREASGAYRALVSAENVPLGTKIGGPDEGKPEQQRGGVSFLGASPDFSHVIVKSDTALEEGAPAGGGLYEWTDGKLRFVGVLPDGERTSEGGLGEPHSWLVRNAVSTDGSRIVWQFEKSNGRGVEEEQLLLRDASRGENGETVRVDAAQGMPQQKVDSAKYWAANGEGSRVFFTSPERLTVDSTAAEKGGNGDLYVFEVTSGAGSSVGRLTDLSVDGHPGETANVSSVIGAGEDGSYVYFVAEGALGGAGQGGGNHLYMEHYEAATRTWAPPKLVATGVSSSEGLTSMESRVSPNGRFVAFMSEQSVTGYENRDAVSGARDQEVFLYDASTGRVVCASCDPTGARPLGGSRVPAWTPYGDSRSRYQPRYLSNGGRLFFDSADALVPADVNGQGDVYEYEPVGEGSCGPPGYGVSASVVYSPAAEGCVGLISSGTSSEESSFMDASELGGDVFFLTTSQLSPRDYDNSYDIYDAHECTEMAPCALMELLKRPPCTTGDACKAAPTPQPTLFGAPSSETFTGAGNVTPTPTPVAKPRAKARAPKCSRRTRACKRGRRSRRHARRASRVKGRRG